MKPVIIIAISILIIGVSITSISAQSQYEIPSWVKGVAGFWAEGKITDGEFGEGLSFLIDSEIIKVPLVQELQNENAQLKAENSELRSKLDLPIPNPTPEPQISITVSTDQDSYESGEVISVKGLVRNYDSDAVTLVVSNPEGDTVAIDQLTPRSNGLFITDFPIGPTFDSSGTYKITADYKGIIAITTFEFTSKSSEIIIYAYADLDVVANGSTVKISGNIEPYDSSSDKGLTYIIISPEEDTVRIGQLTPRSDGSFEKSFVAGGPLWKLKGDYIVEFNYGADSTKVVINYIGGEEVVSGQPDP